MIEPHRKSPSSPSQSNYGNESPQPPTWHASVNDRAKLVEQGLRRDDLQKAANHAGSWLWHGYLAAGKITLLTSQWKSGKTTLISILLARMGQGGELAGLPVAAGRAAVISEEGPENWDARCRKLQMSDHVCYFCCPFKRQPTMADWQGLMAAMVLLRQREGLDLVVIDPLAVFLPGSNENSASVMMECLLPLRDLTARGLSVLLVHHPRKGVTLAGQAARGSGVLSSNADISIEMKWYGNPYDDDRRRWLRAFSRHEETRRNLILELTAAGTDYLVHSPLLAGEPADTWRVVCIVLEDAGERLTQREILEQWPEDFPRPDVSSISRWLRRCVDQGLIRQSGTGRRNDPYRYWLADREDAFQPGPGANKEAIDQSQLSWQTKAGECTGIDSGEPAQATAARTATETADLPSPGSLRALVEGQKVLGPGLTEQEAKTGELDASGDLSSIPVEQFPDRSSAAGFPEPVQAAALSGPASSSAPVPLPDSAVPIAALPLPTPDRPAPPPPPAARSIEEERRRSRRWPYG